MSDVETRWDADEQRLSRLLHRAVDDAVPTTPAPTVPRTPAPATRRRWALVLVPVLAACLVVAVLVGTGALTRQSRPVAPPAGVLQDPTVLLGTWSADVRAGGGEGLLATVDDGTVTFAEDGGCTARYDLATHPDGLLLLRTSAEEEDDDGSCARRGGRPWTSTVARAARFVVDGTDQVRLLSREGASLVELTRQGRRPAADAPAAVVPLPAGVVAPTVADLTGRWIEIGEDGYRAQFRLGRLEVSPDGCGTVDSEFVLSPTGGVLTWPLPTTTAADCARPLRVWRGLDVQRLGLDGEVLVLYAADGRLLSRMRSVADEPSVLATAQGRWLSVGERRSDLPLPGLWLEVHGDLLTHAQNASCNAAPVGYRLSRDGVVERADSSWMPIGTVNCQPGFPPLVRGVVGGIVLDGDQLVLVSRTGNEIARFERADP